MATSGAGIAVVVVVALLVATGFAVLLGTRGTSPGKAALGLRVVHHATGAPIGIGPALLRSLVLGLSALPTFCLGLATLAWTAVMDRDRQRRGWHDHVADSIVLDVRPAPVEEPVAETGPHQIVNLTAMRLVPTPAQAPVSTPVSAPARTPRAVPAVAGRTVVRSPGAPAPARWRVTFDSGESFVVEGLALVGRRPEPRPGEAVQHLVPLRSADMSLSKTHAQFQVAPDGVLVVMDRGSTNGSILVRQGASRALAAGRAATLLDGDRVCFGDRQMIVARES